MYRGVARSILYRRHSHDDVMKMGSAIGPLTSKKAEEEEEEEGSLMGELVSTFGAPIPKMVKKLFVFVFICTIPIAQQVFCEKKNV